MAAKAANQLNNLKWTRFYAAHNTQNCDANSRSITRGKLPLGQAEGTPNRRPA
jgi:hypothetical protein